MLDKIILSSDRKEATMFFTDRTPFGVSSDIDVVPLLLWFLNCPNTKFVPTNDKPLNIEVRRDTSEEVTSFLEIKEAA